VTDQLKHIERELRKLEATTAERPIARRNARRRVLSAMRTLRKAIDAEYPAIVDRTGVKRADHKTRIKRLKATGWREVAAEAAGRYAALGVTIKRVAWKERTTSQGAASYVNGVGWVMPKPETHVVPHERLFAPTWAVAIAKGHGFVGGAAEIRRALSNVKARRSAVVADALTE